MPLRRALRERFAWSWFYAGRRSHEVTASKRYLLALFSPFLSPLLLARQIRVVVQRRRNILPLVRALPLLLVMDVIWSAGEFCGYITGRPVRAPPH